MTSDFLANGGFLKKITEYGISEKRDFDHVGMVSSQQLNLTRMRLETIIKPNPPSQPTHPIYTNHPIDIGLYYSILALWALRGDSRRHGRDKVKGLTGRHVL